MRWARQTTPIATTTYKGLMQKPEGKRPLAKPTRNWEDNIKKDLIYDGKDLAQFICVMIWAKGEILQTSNKSERNVSGNWLKTTGRIYMYNLWKGRQWASVASKIPHYEGVIKARRYL